MVGTVHQMEGKSEKVLRAVFLALANICYDRDAEKVMIGSEGMDSLVPVARKHRKDPKTMRTFVALCRNVSNSGTPSP